MIVYLFKKRDTSKPERGYSTPDLAEDDWRVMQALKLKKPVVIGHSMAGSEMTFLAQQHSSELAAVVCLDANADPNGLSLEQRRIQSPDDEGHEERAGAA